MNRRIFKKIAKREGFVKLPKPNPVLKMETFEPKEFYLARQIDPRIPREFQVRELERLFCEYIQNNRLITIKDGENDVVEASLTILIKAKT